MPKESHPYLHSCHIREPKFRSSVLHLGLDTAPCYTKAVAGEHKVSRCLAGRLSYEDKVPVPSCSPPTLWFFSALLPTPCCDELNFCIFTVS